MYASALEACLKKDKYTKDIFIGVFARDELPNIVSYPACLVANTDNRKESGQHWLALYYNKFGFCTFFDSFGRSPYHFGLNDYLTQTSTGWIYNKKRIQGNSSFCGYYCLLFLFFICRNQLVKFYCKFSLNVNLNDKIIENLIEQSLNK